MRKVVFDSDTASDDAIAMLFAHRKFEVLAVTIVAGNVEFGQQVKNALYTLEYFGYDTPVFLGSRRPIMGVWKTVEEVHGRHGLGSLEVPEPSRRPEREFAADAILRLSREHPGELEILAVSPLTNLALAYLKDHTVVQRIQKVWVMGGALTRGNTTMNAEYNFWVDPEAAKIVLSAGFNLTIVPWEVCVQASTVNDSEWARIQGRNSKADRFFIAATDVLRSYSKKRGDEGGVQPDSLTVAIAYDPAIRLRWSKYFVDVETCSASRGGMLVDYYSLTANEPNCELILEADERRFKSMLIDEVLA